METECQYNLNNMFNLTLQKGDIISVKFWHKYEELIIKNIDKKLYACTTNNDIKIPVTDLPYCSRAYQSSSRWRYVGKSKQEDDYITYEEINDEKYIENNTAD